MERFDVGAAFVGLVFVALGVGFLLDALDAWEMRLGVVLPVVVIGLGLAMLLSALTRSGRAT